MSEPPHDPTTDAAASNPPADKPRLVTSSRNDAGGPASQSSPPTRPSGRFNITVALSEEEFHLIAARTDAAGRPRSHYVRDSLFAYHILRAASPADVLPLTTQAIASVRLLARLTTASTHPATARHLAAAMAELTRTADDLERHATRIAAVLALAPPVRLV
jgi:hypothetical protein